MTGFDYDYTDQSIWTEFGKGHYLDIGHYPNNVLSYKTYIEELKEIFGLSEAYTDKSQKRYFNFYNAIEDLPYHN